MLRTGKEQQRVPLFYPESMATSSEGTARVLQGSLASIRDTVSVARAAQPDSGRL